MASESAIRRVRSVARAAGLALGLGFVGVAGPSGALAQEDDAAIGATAADIEAAVASILAEVFGEAGVADDSLVVDDSGTGGGDINVGGNMGGSVTTGGGGGISIGGGSGGSGSLTIE